MHFLIETIDYSGPMDLLLQLIEKEKVDILDIPIAKITEQYLQAIQRLKEVKNPEEMADFLIMATTLMQIKTRTLLRKPEDEEEDPREELAKRLMEYRRMREASKKLEEYIKEAEKIYPKYQEDLSDYDTKAQNISEDIRILQKVFLSLFEDDRDVEPATSYIEREEYSVVQYANFIVEKVTQKEKVNLRELFYRKNRSEKIVIFLALLELAKDGKIRCRQEKENIVIKERQDEDEQ